MNTNEKQPSSRNLYEIKSCGKVAIDGVYFSDFNVPLFGDGVMGFFAKLDLNHFIRAELYISNILHSIVERNMIPLYGEYRELLFFEQGYIWHQATSTTRTIRIAYSKDCIQHAKLYCLERIVIDGARNPSGAVTIPACVSVTKNDVVLKTVCMEESLYSSPQSEILDNWFNSKEKKTMSWYPSATYELIKNAYHTAHTMHQYTFSIPQLGSLGKIELPWGASIRLFSNDIPISEGGKQRYSHAHDNVIYCQLLVDKDGQEHKLETNRIKYAELKLVVDFTNEQKNFNIRLDFEHIPNVDINGEKRVEFGDNVLRYMDGVVAWEQIN